MTCMASRDEGGIDQNRRDLNRMKRLKNDFNEKFKFDMEFSSEEARYISQPSETLRRNIELFQLFNRRIDITIIDAFACVGGDSVSLMKTFPSCHLHSVQRGETAEEKQRFERLCLNIGKAQKTFAPEADFHPYMLPISIAFSGISQFVREVDLLYLDPPWYDENGQLSLNSMCTLLRDNVFDPMFSTGIIPKFICLKLDFRPTDLQGSASFNQLVTGYNCLKSVGVFRNGRPVYFFHIYWTGHQNLRANLSTVDARLDSILLSLSNHSNY
jgi:hypothetical protein